MRERICSIDILKFLATVAIFNHLAQRFYGSYPSLATGGVLGCGVFFFCSGYTLYLGHLDRFDCWIKRRLARLWPTAIIVALCYGLFGYGRSSVAFALSGSGWFVSHILIFYLVFYAFARVIPEKCCLWLLLSSCVFITMKIFNCTVATNAHFILFMLLGCLVAKNRDRVVLRSIVDVVLCFACIAMFYLSYILDFGAYKDALLLPLMGGVYYLYKVASSTWLSNFIAQGPIYKTICIVGGLSLEMYLCGRMFTQYLPNCWPVISYLFAFIVQISCAYIIRVFARAFAQTFDNGLRGGGGGYDFVEIFKL